MNHDDIIAMAQEAGFRRHYAPDMCEYLVVSDSRLNFFAALVAAAEREACAQLCESKYDYYGHDHIFAAAIRARGEK